MAKTVKITVDGRAIEAQEGELVIAALERAGIIVPHYCYHEALGNPGNCRMCIVEVEGLARPQVSCRLHAKDGLVLRTLSESARRAQSSSLELHLVDHPLDCPVCDQSGECGLQDYYMAIGRYRSAMREDKSHKGKRIPIGKHVMLDQERCILCTRCTRFVDTVSKSRELGIFGRGHEESVQPTPGHNLDNPYSGNLVDICPVGALTDKDFRYQVRVWYLDRTDSICPGCSRGCNISVHTSTLRPWHNQGRRLARIKPRYNPEVNGHWICDEGRYGFADFDADRLGKVMKLRPQAAELPWETALNEISALMRRGIREKGSAGLAVAASGALSNEDWLAFKKLFADTLKVRIFLFTPEPEQTGVQDDLLRRRKKTPNLSGAEALGFGLDIKSRNWEELARAIEADQVWGLYVVDRDPLKVWGEKTAELLRRLDLVVHQGPRKGGIGTLAHYRLPATAWLEEDGHFTNFQGKVQKYRKALEPLGSARPDWWIFDGIRRLIKPEAAT